LRVLQETLEAAPGLGEFSERGRVVPEFNDPTLREVFVYRYRLLYRVSADYVSIVTFLHGARDFSDWARRNEDS
jgi:plasmid stabilization system protein ParE